VSSPRLSHPSPHLRFFALLVLSAQLVWGALPPGLDAPQPVGPYLNNVFPTSAPGNPSGWALVNAFPNVVFTEPLTIVEIPRSSEFLVVGKTGLAWRFPRDPAVTQSQVVQVLDMTGVTQRNEDQGFYSITFHPNFGLPGATGENHVYACYSRRGDPAVSNPTVSFWCLSRFTWNRATGMIDPASEFMMIRQYDPHDWHNGGAAFFGPDGFFYLTTGDGGGNGDSTNSSQKLDQSLFGGVLRIDVDNDPARSHPIRRQPRNNIGWTQPAGWPATMSQGYSIPNDNPWLDPAGGILEEFWAIGLRSPHSGHYDPVTGDIWVGDIGEASREEISRITKGANCQWPYREGTGDGSKPKPLPIIGFDQPPAYDYGRTEGSCVIGGMRYRGAKWNSFLGGKVLFGDHIRGRVWTMTLPENGDAPIIEEIASGFSGGYKAGLGGFATDSTGEVYLMNLTGQEAPGGTILKLAAQPPSVEPPGLLSATGVFTNLTTLATAPGVIPYDVPNPLWSDAADKYRWVILPNNGTMDTPAEKIDFSEDGNWVFPPGTVFVKHFEVASKRLEIRFLVCTEGGGKYGFTYKWNAAGTDAVLINAGLNESYPHLLPDGSVEQRVWSYPSRQDCAVCHNQVSGQALGFRTAHLNSLLHYPSTGRTANQLVTLDALGAFDVDLTDQQLDNFTEARALDDGTAPLEHRIRSYLDTNCSHCHQPGAVGGGFDARLGTPLDSQNLINGIPERYEALGHDGRYIKPGNLALSALNVRLGAVNNDDAMPPLAKNLAHGPGIAALQSYINSIGDAEFASPVAPTARYVRLRSLSGIGGFNYAAIAELNVLDGNGTIIPRSQLSFSDVDLQGSNVQGANGNAYAAIDGNPSSYWETPRTTAAHPHWFTLDLGYERPVGGFTYLPKQTTSNNGRIAGYEFLISNDKVTWTPMTSGTFPDGIALQTYSPPYGKRPARAQIAGPASSPGNKLEVSVTFDMDVSGFTASDLQITGGKVTSLRGSGYYYVASITALAPQVEVVVAEDAVDPEGQGSFPSATLAVAAVPDLTPPAAPANLVAKANTFSTYLSWSAATDNIAVTGYRILRNGIPIATVTGLSYHNTGLTFGSTYHYQVLALDDGENASPPGATATVTTGAGDLAAYRIDAGATTPYTDTQGRIWLQDDGTYANTGKVETFPSAVIAGTTEPTIYKSNRVNTKTTPKMQYTFPLPDGNYELRLHFAETWIGARIPGVRVFDVLVEGALRLDNFDIFVAAGAPASTIKAHVETLPVTVSDGALNVVFDNVLQNPLVSGIEVHLVSLAPDNTVPTSPAPLLATRDYRSAALSWTASTDNSGIAHYRIRRDGTEIATVTGTTFTDEGLERGATYLYQVDAFDTAGNPSPTAALSVTTLGFTDWLAANGLAGETSGDSDGGGLDNLTEYQLEMDPEHPGDDATFRLTCSVSGPTVRVAFPSLKATGSYHLHASRDLSDIHSPAKRVRTISRSQIAAMNAAQRNSQFSEFPAADRGFFVLVFEATSDGIAPSPPGTPLTTPDYRSIQLSWSASTDNQSVAGYRILRDGSLVATVTGPAFTDSGLLPGKGYSYQILAIDSSDNPSAPAAVAATTRSFADWLAANSLAGQTTADSDGGSLDNLTEFHLELDPRNPADDSSFRLRIEPGPTMVKLRFPKLVPSGDFHLHRSTSLDTLNHSSRRIHTVTRAAIAPMSAEQRNGYTLDTPRTGARGFYSLHFEPAAE
jgi:chitodextrinase/glucose/arabinose dehydrogenase/mono/diheme cytochrome c family protein